jgi:hypothetical protein
LEIIDTPDLMIKIAETILQLSYNYPEATFAIFQDIVDILIAWHIDITQPDELIEFISNILMDLRPYWLRDMPFTITLLYQFIEDMESYLTNIDSEEKKRKEIEKIEKIAALLKVYNTVIKSISCLGDDNYKQLKYVLTQGEIDQILETLHRLLVCVSRLYDSKYIKILFGPVNISIELFYDIFDDKVFTLDNLIIEFVVKQNSCDLILSDDIDYSYLKLLSKIIGRYISTNNIEFFKQLISFNGRLWNYKFSQNFQVNLFLTHQLNSIDINLFFTFYFHS